MNIELLIPYIQNNFNNIKKNQGMRKWAITELQKELEKYNNKNSNLYQIAKNLLNELEEKQKDTLKNENNKIIKIENSIEQGSFIEAYNLIFTLNNPEEHPKYVNLIKIKIQNRIKFDNNFKIINSNEIKKITPQEILQETVTLARKTHIKIHIDQGDYIRAYDLLENCVGFREERRTLENLILNDLINKLKFDGETRTSNLQELKKKSPVKFHSSLEKEIIQKEIVYINKYIEEGLYSNVIKLMSYMDDKQKDEIIEKIKKTVIKKITFDTNGNSNFNEAIQNLPENLINMFREDFLNLYMEQAKSVKSNYINFIKNCPSFINQDILINGFIIPSLQKYNFLKTDEIQKNFNYLLNDIEYEKTKAIYIKKYFKSIKIDINSEQAFALSKVAQNNLISARAGSGKTRTIACRAILAIEKENIKPDEILIFSFNKKAKEEIAERIFDEKELNYKKFIPDSAKTFHGLAYNICHPQETIIYDDPSDDVRQKLSMYISKLYHSEKIWTEKFKDLYYSYFKLESENDIHKYWTFSSDEERYNYLRNKKYVTLNREKVKSNGEKWIADFLFEHGINYKYEKVFTSGKDQLYKPDFRIFHDNKEIILEHWGIDLNDRTKTVPKHWTKTWQEYYNEILWKRSLCERKKTPLLETSITDMVNGRNDFEEKLKIKLKSFGITCTKIPQDVLLSQIDAKHKDDIAKKFATFIQTAHKAKMSPEDIQEACKKQHLSERAHCFITLALNVYKEYDIELKKQKLIDFDNILINAFKKIKEQGRNCEIRIDKKIRQNIDKFKLILIDEYQDFSQMFYDLINQIVINNPNIRLFCVGDDWQAINGFAGSELRFFKNYNEYYNNTDESSLTYNYRSGQEIINTGNNIMKGKGKPGICFRKDIETELVKCYIDDVPIKQKDSINFDTQFMYDGKNFFDINHRYFKLCYEIIKQNPNKKVFILSRTNYLAKDNDLSDFRNALISKLEKEKIIEKIKKEEKKEDRPIVIDTIHKFKGKEANIVILLECDNENFPLIHPDNEIYCVFGKHMQDFLDEEKRLFYVAVTRAKEKIYFLCEKSIENDFIKDYPYIKTKKLCFN